MMRGRALLLLLPCLAHAQPTLTQTEETLTVQAEAYRVEFALARGSFALWVADNQGAWQAVLRDDGEPFWFGLNTAKGEARTSDNRPTFSVSRRKGILVVEVTCPVSQEPGILHRACYGFTSQWVLCRSQIDCQALPARASIVRVAPRGDVSTTRLPHYAFRDADGKLQAGAIADLGEPDQYVGVGGWGVGATTPALCARLPYLSLYNPESGAHVAFVYPMYESLWSGMATFLQVYTGGANYLYAGCGPRRALGHQYAFCIYADATGDTRQLERLMPSILAEAHLLTDEAVVPLSAVGAREQAARTLVGIQAQLSQAWAALQQGPYTQETSRRLWLSRYLFGQARRAVRTGRFEPAVALARQALDHVLIEGFRTLP